MNNARSNWWWLPGTLMVLAGILFLVAATYGNAAVWVTIGVVWFVLAGINFRRRSRATSQS
jgi:uncharacterized membrane protein HdeD (DUF308 family)